LILVGTSGFSYPDWRGSFYPEGLAERDMLSYYAARFPVVELNFSYYRMPERRTLQAMAAKTPDGFQFALKAHRSMTHDIGPDPETRRAAFDEFRAALRPLEETGRLGCLLFQFPWKHRPGPSAEAYLVEIRERYPDLPLVMEFRNADWARPQTYELLRRLDLGYCCVDEPPLRGLLPPQNVTTSAVGYVRFHGRNAAKWYGHENASERYDYLYTLEELQEWVPRVKRMEEGTAKTFVFYNNCHAGQAATNARMMLELLGLAGPAGPGTPGEGRAEPGAGR